MTNPIPPPPGPVGKGWEKLTTFAHDHCYYTPHWRFRAVLSVAGTSPVLYLTSVVPPDERVVGGDPTYDERFIRLTRDEYVHLLRRPVEHLFERYAETIAWLRCDR